MCVCVRARARVCVCVCVCVCVHECCDTLLARRRIRTCIYALHVQSSPFEFPSDLSPILMKQYMCSWHAVGVDCLVLIVPAGFVFYESTSRGVKLWWHACPLPPSLGITPSVLEATVVSEAACPRVLVSDAVAVQVRASKLVAMLVLRVQILLNKLECVHARKRLALPRASHSLR